MRGLILFVGLKGLRNSMVGLAQWLLTLGPLGVFSISLLDSAFIPLPGGPDAAVIAMSAVRPQWMLLYVVAATLGSAIGSASLYMVARKGGVRVLRGVRPEKRERIEGLLGRYDMLAIMVPGVLPPPFPYKVFILSAGVFKLKMPRFIVAVLIGRAARFLIEGVLAIEFGDRALGLLKQQGVNILIAVSAVLLIWLGFRYYRLRARLRTRTAAALVEESQPGSGIG